MTNQQEILTTLLDKFKTITDLTSVYEWFTSDLENEDLPALIVKDIRNETLERFIGTAYKRAEFEAILILSDGENTSTELRRITNIITASIGELGFDSFISSVEFSLDSGENLQGGAKISFHVNYEADEYTI